MPRGGKRSGAGRKTGSQSKKTQELLSTVRAAGITPLEYLLSVLRDEHTPPDLRMDAAKSAAPYVHSKMPTAIVAPPPPDRSLSKNDEQILGLYLTGLRAADEG